MSGVAVAVGGAAVVGAVASNNAARKQAKAASSAAQAQSASADKSLDLQSEMFDKQAALNQPWQDAGLKALAQYADNPAFEFNRSDYERFAPTQQVEKFDIPDPYGDFNFNPADLQNDPSYQFRLQQGVNALDASAASRGKLLSGAQDKAVTQYGQDLASQEYANAYNRSLQGYQTNAATNLNNFNQALSGYNANQGAELANFNMGLQTYNANQAGQQNAFNQQLGEYNTNSNNLLNIANIGRGAAGQTQNAMQNYASGASNTIMAQGNALAQGALNVGNAQAQGTLGIGQSGNQGMSNALLYKMYMG